MSTPSQQTVIAPSGKSKNETSENNLFSDADYFVERANWFASKPYGFKFTDRDGHAYILFLPINPNNLIITTNFATNITSTLYGTVEEHSPVRYYDISIEGTTGMAPKYVDPVEVGATPTPSKGRKTFSVKQTISSNALGGFFAKTINTANNIVANTKALFGGTPDIPSGLGVDQSGYLAFHNLYRFLLKYKKDVSGVDKKGERKSDRHPLVFFNYKDANEYKVAVRSFTLRRDKEDPLLYNYSIVLRGYDLASIGGNDSLKVGVKEQRELLSDLGLNGVEGSTFLTKAKKFAVDGKGILGSVASGINQLGR